MIFKFLFKSSIPFNIKQKHKKNQPNSSLNKQICSSTNINVSVNEEIEEKGWKEKQKEEEEQEQGTAGF